MKSENNRVKNFWEIGIQYLHITELVSNETYLQGNQNHFLSEAPITEKELSEETKWSDFNLVIPLLFNFYHGIEVLLKGFINLKEGSKTGGHNLSYLLTKFKKCYPNSSLIPLFEKYITIKKLPDLLAEFCEISSITIDDFYQALKYPESNQGEKYYHYSLEYKGNKGINFFIELRNDINQIRKKSVSLARKEKPNV
ncbi:MAG: hypothetical protein WD607_09995 [Candidatus Paceibacterota bacterium]